MMNTARCISLVVSDVDGTLLDDNKQLTQGAPAAVQRLYQAGIRFTIASARPPRMTRELLQALQVKEPSACFNGALIIGLDEKVLRKVPMLSADAQRVADDIFKHGFDLWVWTDTDWYVSNPVGVHVAHHEEQMGRKATHLTTQDMSHFEVLKLVGVSDEHDALAAAEKELSGPQNADISATRSSAYYLDVTNAKANKGEVVLMLSEMLHIPAENVATIGDMTTDALMFGKSGTSIAMGNASDDVKAQATFVTRTNNQDGFAYAMDAFVLSRATSRVTAD